MDSRVYDHAEILVDHSTEVSAGDNVMIEAGKHAEPLAVALLEEVGRRDATPMVTARNARFDRAYLTHADPDTLATAGHLLAAMEETDVFISLRGGNNPFEMEDVPSDVLTRYDQVHRPILDVRLQTRWVATIHPSEARAQAAQMSTDAYRDFVYRAVTLDWDRQRAFQRHLVDILDAGSAVRIVSGDETDLTLRTDDMIVKNDYGQHNLPGGEVFTAPIPDSVSGSVRFDIPFVSHGREIVDAYLEFEDGVVVTHDAARNADVLRAILETDEGARRVGELGIGMNRAIDRFTAYMGFDEKMGDTVHLALGSAYADTVPASASRNESAVHVDMLVDMSSDALIEVDGDVIQRDGTFRFESGFSR